MTPRDGSSRSVHLTRKFSQGDTAYRRTEYLISPHLELWDTVLLRR